MYKKCIFTLFILCIAGSAVAQRTIYVDGSVATTGDGTLGAPYKTITQALAFSSATIMVAGGTYTDETPYTNIRTRQTLIGSYDSSFTVSDPSATPTIIDMGGRSQLNQRGTFYIGGAREWTIENLVIQNSTTGEYDDTENGGAIYVRQGSNGTLRGVKFYKCATKYEGGVESGPAREGGAVCIRDDSTVVFEDCVFDSCTAVGKGGAICVRSARGGGNNVKIYRCLFINCGSRGGGSAIDDGNGNSQIEIVNCIFANNGVDVEIPSGTARSRNEIRVVDERALIYNCTFVGSNNPEGYMINFGDSGEAGATKEFVNCIVANSTITESGSGTAIFNYQEDYDDTTIIQNNLFFSNSGLNPLDATGTNIIGTNGNIAGDPQFLDAVNGDYYLESGSPGEDAGHTLALVFDDFASTLRPVGSAYDIGALEGQKMNPKVLNVMATATSWANELLVPENTVNDSGLNSWGQHDTTPTNMWLSNPGQEPPVYIKYEFDMVYKLDQMWIWNSNNALEQIPGLGGFGVRTATIEYSTDGETWWELTDVPEFVQAPGTDNYLYNTTVNFNGVAAKFVKITCTSNWGSSDQYGLSEVKFLYYPVQAQNPNPSNGSKGVAIDTTLSWQAGTDATEHIVYFSDNEQSVIDGTAPSENVSDASYGPLSLDLGSMYYWRVDEVNSVSNIPVWEGRTWSFITIDYLVVEDFEDYNDFEPDTVWNTWSDGYGIFGNGASAGYPDPDFPAGEHYLETEIVHSGNQSMPMVYDNSELLSEVTRTLNADWTEQGVDTLTLFYRGLADNAPEQMFVSVDGVVVNNDDSNAALVEEWTQWDIPLETLASQGVNLSNIRSMSIGFGNKANPATGGSGTVFFDDIRLYLTAP